MELSPALLSSWRKGFAPPERLGIADWAKKYVELPQSYAIPGKFDVGRSKYFQDVFAALEDPHVRVVILMASVQSGKSLIQQIFAPYVIANSPGNILWLFQKEAMAKTIAETRINPILYGCEPVKRLMPVNRHFRSKQKIVFPNFTSLIIDSATENSLQSLSIRYCLGDECYLWDSGYIDQFMYRATAYPNTSKVFLVSTPGLESDDFTKKWQEGHCAEWSWVCPKCGHVQPYELTRQREDGTWAGLLWDKNETTCPAGNYNFTELARTLRLSCFLCKHEIADTPQNRRALNDTGRYLIGNAGAHPSVRSFKWNAFAAIDNTFEDIASKYLKAKYQLDQQGYIAPMQEFTTKVMAQPWNTNFQSEIRKAAIEPYDPKAPWPDEYLKFMAVDVQADCFYGVIRAWSKNGESRLLWNGKLETWEQIAEKQKEFGVKDQHVAIDCGYNHTQVYSQCVSHGHDGIITVRGKQYKRWFSWLALKGTDTVDFSHPNPDGTRVRRIYAPPVEVDPLQGKQGVSSKKCMRILWSNPSAKDILVRHRDGKAAKWVTPKDDADYNRQLNGEVKRKKTDPKTGAVSWHFVQVRDNHYFDCEAMIIILAAMQGIIGGQEVPEPSAPPVPDPPASSPDTI